MTRDHDPLQQMADRWAAQDRAVTKNKKPLVKEIVTGESDDISRLVIRLWSEKDEDGRHWWADFSIIEIIGSQGFDPLYKSATGFGTTEIDYAEPTVSGFIKWDGCSELSMDTHVCTRNQLMRLLDAIQQAREEASKLPGMRDLAEEYTPDYTSDSY